MNLSSLNKSTSVITLDALLNAESEASLFAHLREALQSGNDKVILDFRPVDHINSAGVSALVKLTAMAKRDGVKLFAYGLTKRYGEILALTGLDEGITLLDGVNKEVTSLSQGELAKLEKMDFKAGEQSDAGWAPKMNKLHITEKPEGALGKNMDGRRVIGQLQGFGPMWEKTYWINIKEPEIASTGDISFSSRYVKLYLAKVLLFGNNR